MDNTVVIYAKDSVKSYGRIEALHGASLEVQSGEIFGFLCLNGAGKITTIRCLFDLIRSNDGIIRIFGLYSCNYAYKSDYACAFDGRIEWRY